MDSWIQFSLSAYALSSTVLGSGELVGGSQGGASTDYPEAVGAE